MWFLIACTTSAPISTPKAEETSSTGGVTSDVSLTIEATSVASVFRVTWSTPEVSEGRIEYGVGDSYDHEVSASTEDGLTHTALLAGLGAGETWAIRAVATTDGAESEIGDATIEIADAPDRVTPSLVEDDAPDRPGFTLVTLPMPEDNYVAILDRAGRPTWWYQEKADGTVLDAHMTVDGSAIDFLVSGTSSTFKRIGLDGEVLADVTPTVDAHHGFAPLPAGGYLVLAHEFVDVGGIKVMGDKLVELDADFEEVRVIWSVFDTYTAHPDGVMDGDTWDFSHANGVTYDAATDMAIVSLYGLNALVEIDVGVNAVNWRLGGPESSYSIEADATFKEQHGARSFAGGVLVFDNGGIPDTGLQDAASTVRLFTLEGGAAVQTASWTEPDRVYVATLGNAEPDAEGVLTVGWGSAGRLTEMTYDEGGFAKQRDVEMPLGCPFGYVHPIAAMAGATW